MNLVAAVITLVDVCGAVMMIVLAFFCLSIAAQLTQKDAGNIIWAYLLWICLAFTIFAVSRSAGHIVKHSLFFFGHGETWGIIRPFSGAVNTATFFIVGAITLFFQYTWKIYHQILKDKVALQSAREELGYLNQNLERLVEDRTTALAASEHKYRRIFEVSQDMILVTDQEGQMLALNPAGREMLGLVASQGWSRTPNFQQFLQNGEDDWKKILDRIQQDRMIPNTEFDLKTLDGKRMRTILSGVPVSDTDKEGGRIHFLVKDIEQTRRIKKQMVRADKLASIGELSAGIAHEINNPLGIILGYTQLLLRDEDLSSRRYEDLKIIERHVRSCKTIVEDLLNFARSSPPKKEITDIHHVIDEVIGFVCHHSGIDEASIKKDFDPAVKPLLLDDKKIKQVLINLIMNATHAINNSGRITISTIFCENDDAVRIGVEDNGHGIAPENLPKIFDPFFTTKPTGEGTGLGLSVSYGIVKNHGGEILVESLPGRGSLFTIVLPISRKQEKE